MFDMNYDISFTYQDKTFKLLLLDKVVVTKSVDLLADTADIILPEAVLNNVLQLESKIGRGAQVVIQLGYNGELKKEFVGYIEDIKTNTSSLTIKCEDALFLFRKDVSDVKLKTVKVSDIAKYLIKEIGEDYTVNCDYEITYDSFVIHQATAFDVLKKLAEETKGNIYFDTDLKVLHIHPPYIEKKGEVKYSTVRNIENIGLEYKKAKDRKVEVIVESIDEKGNKKRITSGTTGGDKITVKVGSMSKEDMAKIADAELVKRSADAYEGNITGWLIPYVEPTYTAAIIDPDYPEKDGSYYVNKVVTTFSKSGGERSVEFGIKLSA